MSFPCVSKVTCPGTDDPVANLSAEGYDQRSFLSAAHPRQVWRGECCTYICESTVSQEAADLCARNIEQQANSGFCDPVLSADGVLECASEAGCPDCTPPAPEMFWNTEQCCPSFCANGSVFWACVPAHTVTAQSQSEADRIAMSLACGQSVSARFCIDPVVLGCCAGNIFNQIIAITGGSPPFTWSVLAGAFPTGLSFASDSADGRRMIVTGVPVAGGLTLVTMQAMDSLGHLTQATLQVGSLGFTPASLPNATIGVPYSQQLTVTGLPSGTHGHFTLDSGALPTGLSLSTHGLISGTPTGGLPATFTIGVTPA